MQETDMGYWYHLKTWGGFYNKKYQQIHGKTEGDFYFESEEKRQQYIDELRAIEQELGARHLAYTISEGYCCHIRTTLHRVIEYDGKRYYSEYDMGINYPLGAAEYHLEWKWTPGFNDYPLGEDFDYTAVKIIQEWITGAFTIGEE